MIDVNPEKLIHLNKMADPRPRRPSARRGRHFHLLAICRWTISGLQAALFPRSSGSCSPTPRCALGLYKVAVVAAINSRRPVHQTTSGRRLIPDYVPMLAIEILHKAAAVQNHAGKGGS